MSRARASFITVLALLLSTLATHAQPLSGSEISCPRAAFPPVLDGRLDDWPRQPQALMSDAQDWRPSAAEFAEYGGPQDISAQLWLVWDNQSLYLALETRDDNLVRVRSAAEIDRGDSLVLSLAEEAATDGGRATAPSERGLTPAYVNQFVVALLRGASLVWRAEPTPAAGNVKTVGRAIWAQPDDQGGNRVTYELAFPWSELRPLRPLPEARLTLVVSICDDDGKGMEGCLEHSFSLLLAARAPTLEVAPPPGPTPPSPLAPAFAVPDVARFDSKCFTFHDRDALIFGGEIDYARLPSETWADRLALLKAAGMNTIGITVPWSYHQPAPDQTDLARLREFLDLCSTAGLWVQVNLGPYAGEAWEAGAVPGWLLSSAAADVRNAALASWYQALLPVVAEYQLTAGGPVASVIMRPLPGGAGSADPAALEALLARLNSAGIQIPALTANAPPARDNTSQPLADLLDTLSFYETPAPADMVAMLQTISSEENGPATIVALPGNYRTPPAARESLDLARIALGSGATAIILSDFAPALVASEFRQPGDCTGAGIIDAAGGRSTGCGEVRLLASFVQQFGPRLARAMPAPGLVQAADPDVRVAARLTSQEGFIFLWDEKGAAPHQVRLTYTEPGTEAVVNIPQASAIYLPPRGAKILPLDIPLGRGVLRYTTSEIAAMHTVGERTLLVLYGDLDTPGEIALKWPGPPLVLGEPARQSWDSVTNTLVLDYYHGEEDQYLLVDELEIAILSRHRAALAATIARQESAITLSAGAYVAAGSLDPGGLQAVLECPQGLVHVTAALPERPSSVTLDGQPIAFTFTPPARVLKFDLITKSFEEGQRSSSLWGQLGRAIVGGPPQLSARFDRAWLMPDSAAPSASWTPITGIGLAPDTLGLTAGAFATLRARFEAPGRAALTIAGCTDPALVSVNGKVIPALSGSAPGRHADISEFLRPGENEIEIVLHLLPRAQGLPGLVQTKRLPEVVLLGEGGEIALHNWELSPGLAGEQAGWAGGDVDLHRWHLLRLGPWREQGQAFAKMQGVVWYRVPFGLPRPDSWRIPYHLRMALNGTAKLYLNGTPLATCQGDGDYVLPLPAPPLTQGDNNLLAIAAYGLEPQTGLHQFEIVADQDRMTQQRKLDIRF